MEKIFISGDPNGHVVKDMGQHSGAQDGMGFGVHNNARQAIIDFSFTYNLKIVNTCFKKQDEHLISYKNGTHSWQPPWVGCIKYNVDGVAGHGDLVAACGGVPRDHEGHWLDGFMFHIGKGNSFHAEAWVVLGGLKRAWDMNWKWVVIETDCRELVEILNTGWHDEHLEKDLLPKIQRWLGKDWDATLAWCGRDANTVANMLAKNSLNVVEGISFLYSPPDFVVNLGISDVA
ncbi:uncharacterized protein LOC114733214 [Neltuma alba]|uniref:uncharacterized protein LOC114733214 n=1 Tax=Neltuma alba TaxID=207710 RepID=UPI0010A54AFD|nr:uncharacterized protein LOC114733214 [Prosopis alba]